MVTEFEQTKRDVSGHSVLITSWFDDKQQGWQASAPSYTHARKRTPAADREPYRSRQGAIDQLVQSLVRYFADNKRVQGERIFFL